VLRTVPVEALDVDEYDSFYDVGLVDGAERFDESGSLLIVFVNLDSTENLEAGLVGVVHEEERYAGIVFEIAQADVLLVAAQVCEAEESGIDDANEACGAAPMLHVGPAGFAYRGHIEAVAALDEVLLRGAEGVSQRTALLHAFILAPAAVFLLMFFDETGEG